MGFNEPNPIKTTEILAYAEIFGYHSLDERQLLYYYVRVCDNAWMSLVRKRNSK